MTRIWIGCYDFENHPAVTGSLAPAVLLAGMARDLPLGGNGLLVKAGGISLTAVFADAFAHELAQPVRFEAGGLTTAQRTRRTAMRERLNAAAPGVWRTGLKPLVYAVDLGDRLALYFDAEQTESETLALRFATIEKTDPIDGFQVFSEAVAKAEPALAERSTLFNTRWNYSQWRSDMELERKYTFHAIPDTWALVTDLHRELYGGEVEGFFPEPHMGFQVFDYENHIFDVTGPPEEAGYISFIPQVDGPVTVKRKWFRENAELRRESLWPNEAIPVDSFLETARQRVAGNVEKLPAFRRKRFDVNYESLETGHIFGVYFDICATFDDVSEHRFGQVEVEYCRSRTCFPLRDVTPEFEALCSRVEVFLKAHGVKFQHDLYSKLDFAREARGLAAAE